MCLDSLTERCAVVLIRSAVHWSARSLFVFSATYCTQQAVHKLGYFECIISVFLVVSLSRLSFLSFVCVSIYNDKESVVLRPIFSHPEIRSPQQESVRLKGGNWFCCVCYFPLQGRFIVLLQRLSQLDKNHHFSTKRNLPLLTSCWGTIMLSRRVLGEFGGKMRLPTCTELE